jgi:hypothetical protein
MQSQANSARIRHWPAHLEHDGLDDVVDDEHEVGVADPVRHVLLPAREHVVQHDHLVTLNAPSAHQPSAISHLPSAI